MQPDHKNHQEEYFDRKCMPRFLVDDSLCIHHKLVVYGRLLNMKILRLIHDYQLLEQRTWEVGSFKFL